MYGNLFGFAQNINALLKEMFHNLHEISLLKFYTLTLRIK